MAREKFIERKFRADALDHADQGVLLDPDLHIVALPEPRVFPVLGGHGVDDRLGIIPGRDGANITSAILHPRPVEQTGKARVVHDGPEALIVLDAVLQDRLGDELVVKLAERQGVAPTLVFGDDPVGLFNDLQAVCTEFRVPYFACRGYPSQSELYDAGKRLARMKRLGKNPIILHLGDHDPSGLDMTRDADDRLAMFMRSAGADVRRLALNMDQVQEYDPPPNPAKDTDARFANYEAEFGESSWELDALDPDVISGLIRDSLDGIIDSAAWEESMAHEREAKKALTATSQNWSEVVQYLTDTGCIGEDEE